jgi:RNA polymerase sigma-70 factor (ECF subfamily)
MSTRDPQRLETDAMLVSRARAGDEAAFEAIFRRHYAPLCAFATRYVDDRALAEELVQDLFTQLWVDRARWEVRGTLASYLFAAARNRALNHRKRRALERDWADGESGAARDDVAELRWRAASAEDAHTQLESAEQRHHLDRAMASLPERCRLVMHLRWRDQLSYAEIAEVMGISVKGVENQLARGLKALRALVAVLR